MGGCINQPDALNNELSLERIRRTKAARELQASGCHKYYAPAKALRPSSHLNFILITNLGALAQYQFLNRKTHGHQSLSYLHLLFLHYLMVSLSH